MKLSLILLLSLTLLGVDAADLQARSRGGGRASVSHARPTHSARSRGSIRHSNTRSTPRRNYTTSSRTRQSSSARNRASTSRRTATQRRSTADLNRSRINSANMRARSTDHGSVRHSQYTAAHHRAESRAALVDNRNLQGGIIHTPRGTVGAISGDRGTVVAGRGPRGGFVAGKGENGAFAARRYRRDIPSHYHRYSYGNRNYYYGDGYYYEPYYDDGEEYYVETYPPYDMGVEELPEGFEEKVIDGETYYVCNGVYYQLQEVDGEQQYVVVNPPGSDTPDPMTILSQMSSHVGSLERFSSTVVDTMDHVQPSGEMVQTQTTRSFVVNRPNQMKAHASSTDIDREMWYDGRSLTVFNKDKNSYGTLDAPDNLNKLVDFVYEQFQISVPIGDLLYDDLYSGLADQIQSATYVGLSTVDDQPCHHLSFSSQAVDWQVWIDAGGAPLLRKLSIDYKTLPQSPTYTAQFQTWDEDPVVGSDAFTFRPPNGAQKIEIEAAGPAELGAQRLRDELDNWVRTHQHIEDYITIQKKIKMYEPAAQQPNVAKILADEKAKLATMDPVSEADIRAYESKKDQLNSDLQRAIREMQRQEGTPG